MKKQVLLFAFFINLLNSSNYIYINSSRSIPQFDADWAVVGAGPAGISVIGVFLDLGIPPNKIIWIDNEFNVGRLNTYQNVPANTKNKDFIEFLESCKAFKNCAQNDIDKLKKLDLEKEYPLLSVVEPLKQITNCFLNKIQSIKGNLQSLYFENNSWKVQVNNKILTAYNVVLATGSHPKNLNIEEVKNNVIPLDTALDKSKLEEILNENDVVAVVGSAHSAILILKYLSELNVKKIINFYNKPIVYAIDMGNYTLNASTGIKGITAQWAKDVLEKNPPSNLERIQSTQENLKKVLPKCTKIIYAIGFERNEIPSNFKIDYNPTTGIIAPRLFGIGIAFPEKVTNIVGISEYYVGLDSFMSYAQRITPIWMQPRNKKAYKKHIRLLKKFNELFKIEIL